MNRLQALELLFRRIVDIHHALTQAAVPHAFGGAIANAYHGRPRATTDIDVNIFLPETEPAATLASLHALGVSVDFSEAVRAIARDGQIRLRWPPTLVDLFFMTVDFLEEAGKRVVTVYLIDEVTIPILSAEDLIVCKVAYNRAKDWLDLEAIVQIQAGRLDRAYLNRWLTGAMGDDQRVRRFAALAERFHAWEPRST